MFVDALRSFRVPKWTPRCIGCRTTAVSALESSKWPLYRLRSRALQLLWLVIRLNAVLVIWGDFCVVSTVVDNFSYKLVVMDCCDPDQIYPVITDCGLDKQKLQVLWSVLKLDPVCIKVIFFYSAIFKNTAAVIYAH